MTAANQYQKQRVVTTKDILQWNDIVYMFIHVRRGKGFDPLDTSTKLAQTVQKFYYKYPFLLFVGEKGNLYPTELGTILGKKVNAYLKANRVPKDFKIINWHIIIE